MPIPARKGESTSRSSLIKLAGSDIGIEEIEAVTSVLMSGILTNGPHTVAFEDAFARRHQVGHAIAFANGTVALAAIYLALGLGPGDEIIVPSFTFVSTATSVLHVGSTPVFAEVDEDTFNIDPTDAAARLTRRTRAIVAVHYGGQPSDLDELGRIAKDAGVHLIEDAAQAHGAAYRERPIGGFGVAAMFSFTPTKNITMGEGGIVTTNDANLAAQLRLLRNHGQARLYEHVSLGYNWRITEMQAAMGTVQLRKLDAILDRKRANDEYVRRALTGVTGLQLPIARTDRTHPYMLYTLKLDENRRDQVRDRLLEQAIEARVYFPPAHLQPIFRAHAVSLPRTEKVARQVLSIPFHSRLSHGDLDRIATSIGEAVG